MKFGLGVDVFNVFNTVVFGGIQTNITNANFGRVSSQVNTPRVAQSRCGWSFNRRSRDQEVRKFFLKRQKTS